MSYPAISVITPSFNQGRFIEETIVSGLDQGYPNLEYLIVDGGSRDGTVDTIRKYERHLAYWVSEPDRGQSHAINKGFQRATGEIVTWLNSDDLLMPGSLSRIAGLFSRRDGGWAAISAVARRPRRMPLLRPIMPSRGCQTDNRQGAPVTTSQQSRPPPTSGK